MEIVRAEIRNKCGPSKVVRRVGIGVSVVGGALSLTAAAFRLAGYGALLNRLVQVGAIGAPLTLTAVGGVIAWQYSKKATDEKLSELLLLTPLNEWSETGDMFRIVGEELDLPPGISEKDLQIASAQITCGMAADRVEAGEAKRYLTDRLLQLLDMPYNRAVWQVSDGGAWAQALKQNVSREFVASLQPQTDQQGIGQQNLLDLFNEVEAA